MVTRSPICSAAGDRSPLAPGVNCARTSRRGMRPPATRPPRAVSSATPGSPFMTSKRESDRTVSAYWLKASTRAPACLREISASAAARRGSGSGRRRSAARRARMPSACANTVSRKAADSEGGPPPNGANSSGSASCIDASAWVQAAIVSRVGHRPASSDELNACAFARRRRSAATRAARLDAH